MFRFNGTLLKERRKERNNSDACMNFVWLLASNNSHNIRMTLSVIDIHFIGQNHWWQPCQLFPLSEHQFFNHIYRNRQLANIKHPWAIEIKYYFFPHFFAASIFLATLLFFVTFVFHVMLLFWLCHSIVIYFNFSIIFNYSNIWHVLSMREMISKLSILLLITHSHLLFFHIPFIFLVLWNSSRFIVQRCFMHFSFYSIKIMHMCQMALIAASIIGIFKMPTKIEFLSSTAKYRI